MTISLNLILGGTSGVSNTFPTHNLLLNQISIHRILTKLPVKSSVGVPFIVAVAHHQLLIRVNE